MKHPPYHLRSNKAVDRQLFVEAVRTVSNVDGFDLSEATYYSLGGPFLEDLRLMAANFPSMRLVSLESDGDTLKRQRMHLFDRRVTLRRGDVADLDPGESPAVVWLDLIGNQWECFATFEAVLGGVADGSVVKVTLDAEPKRWGSTDDERDDYARSACARALPADYDRADLREGRFPDLLQRMVRVVAERACGAARNRAFQLVSSFTYKDQARMFTLTGVACAAPDARRLSRGLRGWRHGNLRWVEPKPISVPELSVRERLHLERHLPADHARHLQKALGYSIADSRKDSIEALAQYALYHEYLPQFVRVFI